LSHSWRQCYAFIREAIDEKTKLGPKRRKAIDEKAKKLLNAGFIREVQYTTWLANMMMVKNSNEKLRMRTNYTDLYKACPIDSYPLPSKDFLVDEASKFSILSFSYAYFEYNNNTYVLVG